MVLKTGPQEAVAEPQVARAGLVARLRETASDRQVSWRQYVVYIGFVGLFLFFAITLHDSGFLSQNNLLNIVRQTATISVMAVAMTYVLSAGEIDLSIGAVVGLSSVTTAMAIGEWGIIAGVLAGLGTGLAVGTVNAWVRTAMAIPSFLVTLASLGIVSGLAMWISDAAPIPIRNETFNSIFGGGNVGPIPVLIFWTIGVVVLGHVVYTRTGFGRQVLATGGNPVAAKFSGVNIDKIRRRVLMLSGLGAGLAAVLYAGRLHSARYQFGEGDELSVIAAVVLGGTSLFGGAGSVVGALFGSLMIGLMNNGLILMGLDASQQLMARGVIIVLAVALGPKK